MAANAQACPDCGSSQDPSEIGMSEELEASGFTSWAPGFEPNNTGRNTGIALIYILFSVFGAFVLAFGYLEENPESGGTLARIMAVLIILAGLGSISNWTAASILGGIVAVLIGIAVFPVVRERIGFGNPPPGIDEGNTDRRNAMVSIGYGFGALLTAGATLPSSESDGTGTSGSTTDGSGTTGATDDSTSSDSPAGTSYYDSSTGIGIMQGVDGEVDSVGSLYISGTIENFSNNDYSYVEVTWDVEDSSGAKIADALDNTSGLEAGQRWNFRALAVDASNASSYSLGDITAY
jgi:hypothetical protein